MHQQHHRRGGAAAWRLSSTAHARRPSAVRSWIQQQVRLNQQELSPRDIHLMFLWRPFSLIWFHVKFMLCLFVHGCDSMSLYVRFSSRHIELAPHSFLPNRSGLRRHCNAYCCAIASSGSPSDRNDNLPLSLPAATLA